MPLYKWGKLQNTMRGVLIFSYLFVIFVVFGVWAAICIHKGALQEMAIMATLTTTIIGIVTGGKFLEKREETKTRQMELKEKCADLHITAGVEGKVDK